MDIAKKFNAESVKINPFKVTIANNNYIEINQKTNISLINSKTGKFEQITLYIVKELNQEVLFSSDTLALLTSVIDFKFKKVQIMGSWVNLHEENKIFVIAKYENFVEDPCDIKTRINQVVKEYDQKINRNNPISEVEFEIPLTSTNTLSLTICHTNISNRNTGKRIGRSNQFRNNSKIKFFICRPLFSTKKTRWNIQAHS
jgi:hypothetical protein